MSIFDDIGVAMIPSGYKAGKLYSVLPNNGNGDFDFTRATSATRINSKGLIESVGNNIPRLEYPIVNGVVGDCPALLLEPQRTNNLIYSEDFTDSYWGKANTTVTPNSIIAPSGLNDGSLITATGTNPRLTSNRPFGTGDFVFSWFAKKGTSSYLKIRVYDGSANHDAVFNLENGTLTSGNGIIEPYINDWFRCSLVYTSAGYTHYTQTYISDSSSGNLYLWGSQIEEGEFPTSYIATNGASVTRNGDVCNNSGTSGDFNSEEGVLYVEIKKDSNALNNTYSMITIGDALNNRLQIYLTDNSNDFGAFVGSSSGTNNISSAFNYGSYNKIALSYNSSGFKVFHDGTLVGSNSNTISGLNLQELKFRFATSTSYDFYGNVKCVAVFKSALTDDELEALTS